LSRATPSERHGDGDGEGGFTMIEAVVALALMAVMLAAIGSLVASAANGTRTLEQHIALVETARLVGTSVPRRAELSLGDLAGEVLGHRWRADVSPFFGGGSAPIPESPWIPQHVVVRVQSPSGAILAIESVRLQKRPSQ
jgi:general secretion pathway protein I